MQNPKRRKTETTSTGVVTVWENVRYKDTSGKIVTEEITISKQTLSDVYCQPCNNAGEYFRMVQETFFFHLKRKHDAIINAPVTCNFLPSKVQ